MRVEIDMVRLQEVVNSFGTNEFTTTAAYKAYFEAPYHAFPGGPGSADFSLGAAFGRMLSASRDSLGIMQIDAGRRATDDGGKETTTAVWKRCP